MIEVEIQNFQSIDKVAFKIEGFTVCVGRSNMGKSALIRAIQCALTGASGTDFVRHGLTCERRVKGNKKCSCKATVVIKTEALQLTWEKGDADNQYTLVKDGVATKFTAVNRGTPDFLLPDFAQVAIGDTTELIQVSKQFAPIFLLDKPGSVIADVLSDVAKLDDINVAMKLVATDRREAVSTRNVRDKDVTQLKADLRQYEGLDAAVTRAQMVQTNYVTIQEREEQLAKLDSFVEALRVVAVAVKGLTQASGVTLPDGAPLKKLGRELQDIQRFVTSVGELKPVVQRLVGVGKVHTPDVAPLKAVVEDAVRLNTWAQRVELLEVALNKNLAGLPEPDAGKLSAAVKTFSSVSRLTAKYEALVETVNQLDKLLAAITAEEAEVMADFDALGICPTCSLPLHPERRESA